MIVRVEKIEKGFFFTGHPVYIYISKIEHDILNRNE